MDSKARFIRPESVQEKVDYAFSKIKNGPGRWMYGGCTDYSLLGIKKEVIIEDIVSKSTSEEIYIIDVGSANGKWGESALEFILSKKWDKKFHIFNLTGGKNECDYYIKESGNVTLYQFNQFKIENIDKELRNRGYNIQGKVHLIVSSWTLRHLVDPIGTLDQMYNLLTSCNGVLMANGFLFKSTTSNDAKTFPHHNEFIGFHCNAICLFDDDHGGHDIGPFMMVRTNDLPLGLPVKYTGNTYPVEHGYQCESLTMTEFEVDKKETPEIIRKLIFRKNACCLHWYYIDDDRCKKLYSQMKQFVNAYKEKDDEIDEFHAEHNRLFGCKEAI